MNSLKSGRIALALAILLAVSARDAAAFLETGTLLTNAASATYMGGGQGTSVTYSATAKILVANPSVYLWKRATPTAISATSGGTTTFLLCFSNGGANTAFNVTITDKLPNNTYAIATGYSAWYIDLAGAGQNPVVTWATGLSGAPWNAGLPPASQGPSGSVYLRWVAANLGVGRSGCIVFQAEIIP